MSASTEAESGISLDDVARKHAEKIGVYEYYVNGKYMEYWSFYSEGWYFVRYDLEKGEEVFRGAHIPWTGVIPAFLKTSGGSTLYNYVAG